MKKNRKKTEVLDLAERQRHAFLVEQVAQGKVLSPAQVRELADYEQRVPEPDPPSPPRSQARSRDQGPGSEESGKA